MRFHLALLSLTLSDLDRSNRGQVTLANTVTLSDTAKFIINDG